LGDHGNNILSNFFWEEERLAEAEKIKKDFKECGPDIRDNTPGMSVIKRIFDQVKGEGRPPCQIQLSR
jgi:hypothetical protein